MLTEILAQCGFDFQILDCEHGGYDYATLLPDILACERQGCAPLVRVSGTDPVEVQRCLDLGFAIRDLIEGFPQQLRVGIAASGGLSHLLVNEALDHQVVEAISRKDFKLLGSLEPRHLQSGSSEIRNWICVAAAALDLDLDWIEYVPAYRSRALTGGGLGFAAWA